MQTKQKKPSEIGIYPSFGADVIGETYKVNIDTREVYVNNVTSRIVNGDINIIKYEGDQELINDEQMGNDDYFKDKYSEFIDMIKDRGIQDIDRM